ncbi:Maf family protein [Tautonia rosea]|uniref:Maf family protein n=1 Tax=Tautonia rosea TaxID=2728037 RepID=UPI001474AFE8|nr:nucleoside triphosphate pyrophosphatase [Tautonia rosea]
MDLILASTSPYRRALLERLGLPFRCRAPGVDEDALKNQGLSPRELADRLAIAKADAVARLEPNPAAIVIGSDQLVAFEGRVLGKPGSVDRAVEQLLSLSGRDHELITAMAVIQGSHVIQHTDVARLHVRPLSQSEIERYVLADQPIDCAGAYKLESRGIVLFEQIDCADHSAITGLPLMALTTILRDLGVPIP